MARDVSPETVKPPVALGCFFGVSVVVVLFGILAFAIVFLESGADTGALKLSVVEAYAPGSIEFVGDHNLFLARLPDGSFVAMADMDAQNRQSSGARCRVGLAAIDDPSLWLSPEVMRSLQSPRASGSTQVLRETCYGAIYDITGVILARDGRNLDQYAVDTSSGVVVVDRSKRSCTHRTQAALFVSQSC